MILHCPVIFAPSCPDASALGDLRGSVVSRTQALKRRMLLAAVCAIWVLAGLPVRALNPSLDIRPYGHKSWTQADGFSIGNIFAIAQIGDGYLWLGGEFGLFRFDGVNAEGAHTIIAGYGGDVWETAEKDLGPSPIAVPGKAGHFLRTQEADANKLLRDRDGGLWTGTVERGLIHVHHGRTDAFTKSDGLSGNVIPSLFEDRGGNIWVSTIGESIVSVNHQSQI